ncbi:MAG: 4'-phosphopantetheinyl transferase superfamily protein [Acidimicrobiia bacterium]|nr:4'-phosphopantetheinyl transferase superfamily protein [Acidimicrobiia bacterium]
MLGIDLVELARFRTIEERGEDEPFRARVLTDGERRWVGGHDAPDVATAVCIAVKEAFVKLLGGRPEGFDWKDVEVHPPAALPAVPARLDAVTAVLAGAGAEGVEYGPCSMSRAAASRFAALVRTPERPSAAPWAAWGRLGPDVVAVATWA